MRRCLLIHTNSHVLLTAFVALATLVSSGVTEPLGVEKARCADAFVDAIGVNVHLSYYDTAYSNYFGVIKPRLLEAGIRHVRDGCPSKDQKDFQNRLNDLGQAGIRSMLICSPQAGSLTNTVAVLKQLSVSVERVEGPNETDGAGIAYQGRGFPEGTRAFQNDLFAAVKADPELARLPVVVTSISNPEKASLLGPLASADFANTHCYAGGYPPGFRWNWYMERCITNSVRPILATESGYHTAFRHTDGLWMHGVSEAAQGKYLSRMLAEYFTRGILRTYVYELLNLKDAPQHSESNFGIVRANGEPKPAFTAIQNLIALLSDAGPVFEPASLSFAINGEIEPARHLLLQKRDGRFFLLLWINAVSFDTAAKQDKPFTPQPARLVFAKPITRAKAWLPLERREPVASFGPATEVTVNVPDHLLVLEIETR